MSAYKYKQYPSIYKTCSRGDKCLNPLGSRQPATPEFFYKKATSEDGLRAECKYCFGISRGALPISRHVVPDGYKRCKSGSSCLNKVGPILPKTREYFRVYRDKFQARCLKCMSAYHKSIRTGSAKRAAAEYRHLKAQTPEEQEAQKNRSIARYARKHSLPVAFRVSDWRFALEYFGNCCAVCGRPAGLWHTLAQDHWIPLTPNYNLKGDNPGSVPTNIVPLCHGLDGCNNRKHNNDPVVWLIDTFGPRKAKTINRRISRYFAAVSQRK